MKIDQKLLAMREIEERLELIISRFDSALWLEQVFKHEKDPFEGFFTRVKWSKKVAQKELRNLRKRIQTAQRKVYDEKEKLRGL